ncbi:cytochrome b [Intrasporangium calvum]|uniref:Cytochrome bc1 complex cytochrome b subunit n=1 Tax=Intrasporangium calvum (strain ATCC 23552 / DSM 43043 / JCM 3097 / NBRC 12989 / NCIMB 10167 / NRRL B-3866 / 7 KIP) TaxID=710696 RepID=E6SCB7_INTC7|nr:ubiquinol-cytochrome c reductase cytochrome b subunit [Intrasporangium calvum]ADU48496.1 menaquinol-cytochrome c reductase cytochrome b subunit precursor [Intrasporangium calvum DSM 43043]AXG13514.1 ubiquinol-cytochrome c reductase cytochrome b subunit [Intrasporangium calvum]
MSATYQPRHASELRDGDRAAEHRQADQKPLGGIAGWVDDRTGAAKGTSYLLKKVFPDHWSFMLGEIAMYSMIVCLLTGVFLTFWFVPSASQVVYDGSYVPLQGIVVSDAYRSTLAISFDIRGGLLIRQIHHWAALIFVVAVFVHMARVFFTGAFRKPREINWVFGTILSLLAAIEGFAGYSLPDDLLSGTGIRAMNGFVQSAPVIGSYLSYFIFGGAFPGESIIPRLYSVHVLLIPAILVALFTAHILLVFVHKHTQYPGPGRTNNNVVGYPFMPVYIAKAGGFFFIVFGVIALVSAVVTINPIWAYGPYDPSPVTAGSQPDWYMGFADGALRLVPGWLEFESWGGFTWSMNIFPFSLILLPAMWTLIGVYPFVEKWVTGDNREHHLLDRPRNAPTRTAIGVAGIVMYAVLMFAAGNDLMAIKLHLSINDITNALRLLFFIGPPIAFWITKRICLSLQRADRQKVLHGRETGTIWRHADGRFEEIHAPLTPMERWPLVQHEVAEPFELTHEVDANGVARPAARKDRLRAKFSHFYFRDRVPTVTPSELEAAHHAPEAIEAHGKAYEEAREPEAIEPAGRP